MLNVFDPNAKKADLSFEFQQETAKDGFSMMLLKITNNTKKQIFMNALMTVPDRKGRSENFDSSSTAGIF
jgi:hypothetical protein